MTTPTHGNAEILSETELADAEEYFTPRYGSWITRMIASHRALTEQLAAKDATIGVLSKSLTVQEAVELVDARATIVEQKADIIRASNNLYNLGTDLAAEHERRISAEARAGEMRTALDKIIDKWKPIHQYDDRLDENGLALYEEIEAALATPTADHAAKVLAAVDLWQKAFVGTTAEIDAAIDHLEEAVIAWRGGKGG